MRPGRGGKSRTSYAIGAASPCHVTDPPRLIGLEKEKNSADETRRSRTWVPRHGGVTEGGASPLPNCYLTDAPLASTQHSLDTYPSLFRQMAPTQGAVAAVLITILFTQPAAGIPAVCTRS